MLRAGPPPTAQSSALAPTDLPKLPRGHGRAATRAMISRLAVLAISVVCQPAQAWQVLVQVSCETTIRGSSETSTAATRADNRERRAERKGERTSDGSGAIEGSQCQQDDECSGWCRAGRCVDHLTPAGDPVPVPIPKECELDEHCAAGRVCQRFQCVEAPPVVAPPAPAACSSDAQCQPGQSCTNGTCLSLPPRRRRRRCSAGAGSSTCASAWCSCSRTSRWVRGRSSPRWRRCRACPRPRWAGCCGHTARS